MDPPSFAVQKTKADTVRYPLLALPQRLTRKRHAGFALPAGRSGGEGKQSTGLLQTLR